VSRDYAYEAALRFANRVRKEEGLKPLKRLPKGWRHDSRACPLAEATGYEAGTSELIVGLCEFRRYPRDVRRFVSKFDKGKYPELVA
jgi:hypothetical protein